MTAAVYPLKYVKAVVMNRLIMHRNGNNSTSLLGAKLEVVIWTECWLRGDS
jgi:hypothetical protein